jgi:hypothetical protein
MAKKAAMTNSSPNQREDWRVSLIGVLDGRQLFNQLHASTRQTERMSSKWNGLIRHKKRLLFGVGRP